jgi:Thymosin beta-4 family
MADAAQRRVSAEIESEITGFDSSKLKHAEVHEKTCLPSSDGIISLYLTFNWWAILVKLNKGKWTWLFAVKLLKEIWEVIDNSSFDINVVGLMSSSFI